MYIFVSSAHRCIVSANHTVVNFWWDTIHGVSFRYTITIYCNKVSRHGLGLRKEKNSTKDFSSNGVIRHWILITTRLTSVDMSVFVILNICIQKPGDWQDPLWIFLEKANNCCFALTFYNSFLFNQVLSLKDRQPSEELYVHCCWKF